MKEAQVTQALAVRPEQAIDKALEPEDIKAPITAAQAKVEAVANLTMKAYEAASTLKLTPEEVSSLQADFPDEAFKPGAAGKEHLIYIEHAFLRDRLNQVFGPGQWSIIPRNRWAEPFTTGRGTEGSRVYVEAMLVIRGAFVAEAVGAMEYYPKNESQNYGDAVEGAKTAALRRCAKELGIGLQAWKQDWCNGWWDRRRKGQKPGSGQKPPPSAKENSLKPSQTHFDRPGGMSTPPDNRTPQATGKAANPAPSPATRPPQQAIFADIDTLKRMIAAFSQCLPLAHEFFVKAGCILETEKLEDLPLRFVPVTRRQFQALEGALAGFGNGEEAKLPYPPNPEAEPAKDQGRKSAAPPKDMSPKASAVLDKEKRNPEWFFNIVCPIPNKGQKRDAYLKAPDSILSLYRRMKEGDEPAQKRLWGFAKHWEPSERQVGNKVYPISEEEKIFREALDCFVEWEERHGKDTQQEEEDDLRF